MDLSRVRGGPVTLTRGAVRNYRVIGARDHALRGCQSPTVDAERWALWMCEGKALLICEERADISPLSMSLWMREGFAGYRLDSDAPTFEAQYACDLWWAGWLSAHLFEQSDDVESVARDAALEGRVEALARILAEAPWLPTEIVDLAIENAPTPPCAPASARPRGRARTATIAGRSAGRSPSASSRRSPRGSHASP